jgi:hypothetical protein
MEIDELASHVQTGNRMLGSERRIKGSRNLDGCYRSQVLNENLASFAASAQFVCGKSSRLRAEGHLDGPREIPSPTHGGAPGRIHGWLQRWRLAPRCRRQAASRVKVAVDLEAHDQERGHESG